MENEVNITVLGIGSQEFQRYILGLRETNPAYNLTVADLSGAWSAILEHKPHVIVTEIGIKYTEHDYHLHRNILNRARERFGNDIYHICALMDPTKFVYGGLLLFQEDSLEGSGLIDMFIANPPFGILSLPSVKEQLSHAIKLYGIELQRRLDGKIHIPPLATPNWVYSMCDPSSRELWMIWLPRYAQYINESPVITGETGAGKTRLAKAIHTLSGRTGNFVSMTPRDFSSSELIQAELFGAVEGAYTGAVDKWGLVKAAEGGTLFIDELQSIDTDLQGKLITFIENRTYRRVGSTESIKADVRFVFATNQKLDDMVNKGILREDFAYRIKRVNLNLLPLRERPLDVPSALAYSLAKICKQRPSNRLILGCTQNAYRLLCFSEWRGNMRELDNLVANFWDMCDIENKEIIDDSMVNELCKDVISCSPVNLGEIISEVCKQIRSEALKNQFSSLDDAMDKFRQIARDLAIDMFRGNEDAVAEILGENVNIIELYKAFQDFKHPFKHYE